MKVRPTTLEDYDGIMAVHVRNGLAPLTRAEWEHLISKNPSYPPESDVSVGWVLENDAGEVVGTYGSFPVAYQYGGRRLLAAVSHSWAVDEPYRRASILLAGKYFQQKHVDFLINTTANEQASQVFATLKAKPVPYDSAEDVLCWVIDHVETIAVALRAKRIPAAGLWKHPAGAAAWAVDVLRRLLRRGRVVGNVLRLDYFDERFDVFWSRLQRTDRMIAVRDRQSLAWHFEFALARKAAAILVLEDRGEMAGYMVLMRQDLENVGLRRFRVIDLQLLHEIPGHMEALLAAALRVGRAEGVHVLEAVGFTGFKRCELRRLAMYRRKTSECHYWYKALNPAIEIDWDSPRVWEPSAFDGDAGIWPAMQTA